MKDWQPAPLRHSQAGVPCGSSMPGIRVLLPLVIVCTSCSSAPTRPIESHRSVAQQIIAPPQARTYPRQPGVKYVLPEASAGNPTPRYPEIAAGLRGEQIQVVVRLVIDAQGKVTAVHPSTGAGQPRVAPFLASVTEACLQWRFTPLQARRTRVVPDGEVSGLPKVKVVTETETLPFSLDYRFTFSDQVVVDALPTTGIPSSL